MSDEMLASVCELAFDVAKEGNAPSAMKNYLYLAQRPPRAYSVAQRALEEDPGFRGRVAERATIENVGEAGYLWLHRPLGWEQRFSDLIAGVEPIDGVSRPETPLAQRPPMPAAPSFEPAPQPTPSTQLPPQSLAPAANERPTSEPPVTAPRSQDGPRSSGASSTVNSIEDELSSLRGLVDRLADERQNVRSSVTELEVELETRRAENMEMFAKLSALRNKLTTVQSTESTILLDRDRALARVTELEADVARLTSEVERMAAEAEGSSSEHQAALTDLALLASERDSLRGELAAVKSEHETSMAELQALRAERDELAEVAAQSNAMQGELDSMSANLDRRSAELEIVRSELDEASEKRDRLQGELDAVTTDRNSLTGQFNETLTERDHLQSKLDQAVTERGELRSQLATAEGEGRDMAERLEALHEVRADNVELASRLSVAEQARIDLEGQLEEVSGKWKTATRQLSVFENVNNQLDAAVSERDALHRQLSMTNDALTELHGRIGTSHDHIRNELTSIESTFGEGIETLPASAPVPTATDDHDAVVGGFDTDTDGDEMFESSDELFDAPDLTTPDFNAPELEASDIQTPGIGAPDFEAPESESSDFDAPDVEALGEQAAAESALPDAVSGVDDLDVPSFGDGVDFGADDDSSLDVDGPAEDFFDGEGLELDPTTLGGRTIGDMFRGDDESAIDHESAIDDAAIDDDAIDSDPIDSDPTDQPTIDADSSTGEHTLNGNGHDALELDAPEVDALEFDEPAFDDLRDAMADEAVDDSDDDANVADEIIESAQGRRRLSISADLNDAAFAQQVVASPDVVLLIDGDGAAGLGWPHLDVATRRGALVDYLGTLTAESGAAADVVFARPVGDEDALPVSRAVRVRIADAEVADSPIFSAIVDGYPEEWPIAIITNEPALLAQAEELEATVLSNDQLLDLFLDLNAEG